MKTSVMFFALFHSVTTLSKQIFLNLYGKFNHLNKTLQGKTLNLVKCKSKITSFRNQVELYGNFFFISNQFSQFAILENLKLQISEGEVEVFPFYLEQFKNDNGKRFNDVFLI